MEVAEQFKRGEATAEIARELRVTPRSVRRWRQLWRRGGVEALASPGPVAREAMPSAEDLDTPNSDASWRSVRSVRQ
ncbi:helix-turn-helix domain-containing protein [Streptomyces cadmiisoli]|uniref:helix-turn-helix domain-containing protein n=1 Tax=Streptomyces cadmiisoli TaxID=2184053 RepID=UPI003D727935